MMNHKETSSSLTIEELRVYVNEYQKRKYSKVRKSKYNAEYYNKIKHDTESTIKGKSLNIFNDMKGGDGN